MFVLFASMNCGTTYQEEAVGETLEELHPKMDELNTNHQRWYLEKDGQPVDDVVCAIHSGVILSIQQLTEKESSMTRKPTKHDPMAGSDDMFDPNGGLDYTHEQELDDTCHPEEEKDPGCEKRTMSHDLKKFLDWDKSLGPQEGPDITDEAIKDAKQIYDESQKRRED
jgi:hypothetical protein